MIHSRYCLNSASSVDEEGSPKDYNGHGYGNEDDDNSVLWSAATGGGKQKFYYIYLENDCLLSKYLVNYQNLNFLPIFMIFRRFFPKRIEA